MAPKFQETNNNGFSFLNILENPSKNSKKLDENDDVYVHPMVKRSASALSTKSLEMCTESLGSETGSDVSENGDEFSPRERLKESQRSKYRKIRRSEFPPPLTSISGSDGTVKVKHYREGGRLVIKAISFSNCGTNFQAERRNGRLKLTLFKDYCESYEIGRVENEKFESKRVKLGKLESERVEMEEYESERVELENYKKGGEVELDENNDEVAVAEDDDHEEVGSGGGRRWDSVGNLWRIVGKGELKMTRRCNEGENGNKVFSNWRSSCMAIS